MRSFEMAANGQNLGLDQGYSSDKYSAANMSCASRPARVQGIVSSTAYSSSPSLAASIRTNIGSGSLVSATSASAGTLAADTAARAVRTELRDGESVTGVFT